MKRSRNTLAVRYTTVGADLLVDFVNTRHETEAFERFQQRWSEKTGDVWVGDMDSFFATQQIVWAIWEGKQKGEEDALVKRGLGLGAYSRPEYEGSSLSLIEVYWKEGSLRLAPRDLNDFVWLTLLQHKSELAICANRDGGCQTPYFLRRRRSYKFCSDACAQPAQREAKLAWWREHGDDWREERRSRRRRKVKRTRRA